MVVGILNSFYVVFAPLLAPIPISSKSNEKQYRSVLVGWAAKSKNRHRRFKVILCCFCSISSPHSKFDPNRTKKTEVRNFHFWSVLVGRAGRS